LKIGHEGLNPIIFSGIVIFGFKIKYIYIYIYIFFFNTLKVVMARSADEFV
jgi:hypothetical protein